MDISASRRHRARLTGVTLVMLATGLVSSCGSDTNDTTEVAADPTQEVVADPTQEVVADPVEPTLSPVDSMGASCVAEYSTQEVASRAFAFDGTITEIGSSVTDRGDEADLGYAGVTFTVQEWFAGGTAPEVTVDLFPSGIVVLDGSSTGAVSSSLPDASYDVGTRLLVSGEPRWGGDTLDDPVSWPCGFRKMSSSLRHVSLRGLYEGLR